MTRRSPRISPRLVVLGALLAYTMWALVLPWVLARPPGAASATAYAVGLVAFGVALVLVLRSAVTPGQSARARTGYVAVLAAVSLALWPAAHAWAEPGSQPWAWLAGFVIGVAPLAIAWPGALAVGTGLTAATALGAAVFDDSVLAATATALGCAGVVWLMCQVLVWLLRVLWAEEAGREAEAALSVAQERLRVSRELHDVLGHRLGVIALKAELAADLAARDPARARSENEEIRAIAVDTLAEARAAVQGDTVADLATQLTSAELVLSSAGIEAEFDVDGAAEHLPDAESRLLAAVVREGVTNVLRHSDARAVSLDLTRAPSWVTLRIVNDGARSAPARDGAGTGTGLAALAARCAAAGGRLVSGPVDGGRFELRAELAPQGAGSR
ncbi:histidine kinase [Beutenbergia cavernae DSM 12333]|uniref:histidine kinase n=1 Tax=Beutenbergia cavernae (strain ATCC BAA-8 / DSM 12333 / CCUG 43141 / JCM 11478 / NBRC 16432 / NCIMB 13614 / HKI 0122) TaxID=471853 RepID=C5BXV8_BEUC1|nr:histidine kinase [Beutenbergia cavernae]ACQ78852.1 histidine kinase [Beutenbergia cavernae DSM 12333]